MSCTPFLFAYRPSAIAAQESGRNEALFTIANASRHNDCVDCEGSTSIYEASDGGEDHRTHVFGGCEGGRRHDELKRLAGGGDDKAARHENDGGEAAGGSSDEPSCHSVVARMSTSPKKPIMSAVAAAAAALVAAANCPSQTKVPEQVIKCMCCTGRYTLS